MKKIKISYLGPKGSFSEIAAKKFLKNKDAEYVAERTIGEIFERVERGEVNFGIVPVENSFSGSVGITLDKFFSSKVKIFGEITIDVEYFLLSNKRMKEIKTIYSHPQAIPQCIEWINKNIKDAEIIETSSTSMAAKLAFERGEAAIASKNAAKEYKIKVLRKIASSKTRFFIISMEDAKRGKGKKDKKSKTSVLFTVKHEPGSLVKALEAFRDYNINMTKIESRPIKGRLWEYAFFVDFEGHKDDKRVKEALKKLREKTIQLKILGSYSIC
ncbi:MAG: prephenate dehydratase [Candidatus Micrarchaeia archaeon]